MRVVGIWEAEKLKVGVVLAWNAKGWLRDDTVVVEVGSWELMVTEDWIEVATSGMPGREVVDGMEMQLEMGVKRGRESAMVLGVDKGRE